MTNFDEIKSLREEIQGLSDVEKLISLRIRENEGKLAAAEIDHNAFLKMFGTVRSILEQMQNRLRALEADLERK